MEVEADQLSILTDVGEIRIFIVVVLRDIILYLVPTVVTSLGDMVHVVVICFVTVLEIFALELEEVAHVLRHMIDTTLQEHVVISCAAVLLLLSPITALTAVILQISIMLKEQMKIHMSSYKKNLLEWVDNLDLVAIMD